MFCVYLRTNSDLCHLQHKLIGFYNPDEKSLQRGTDWVFKQSDLPLGLVSNIISSDSPPKPCRCLSPPNTPYMPCPSHSSRFYHATILGEEYRSLSSSLCSFLHSLVTSSLLGQNIPLNTLFSNTPQPTFLPQCERPSSTPIHNNRTFVCPVATNSVPSSRKKAVCQHRRPTAAPYTVIYFEPRKQHAKSCRGPNASSALWTRGQSATVLQRVERLARLETDRQTDTVPFFS